jgi:hypothetical protein
MAKPIEKITIHFGVFCGIITDLGHRVRILKSGEVAIYGPQGPIRFYPYKQRRRAK